MKGGPACQVTGCSDPVTTLLPVAPLGLPVLAQVAAAPLRPCCRRHDRLVSDRYAVALDWALLRDLDAGRAPMSDEVDRICERLRAMDTAWSRSLFRTLDCLPRQQ